MSADAIFDLTEALRARIEKKTGQQTVHVGPPLDGEVAPRSISLFLFHIEPNRELRNTPRFAEPTPNGAGPNGLLERVDALPIDLRFLISVFRRPQNGDEPAELTTLGLIMQTLSDDPMFADSVLPNQHVRLTLEPMPMEETSRVWGLFHDMPYRTSVVYLASPLFILSPPDAVGPPVVEREHRPGVRVEDA